MAETAVMNWNGRIVTNPKVVNRLMRRVMRRGVRYPPDALANLSAATESLASAIVGAKQ